MNVPLPSLISDFAGQFHTPVLVTANFSSTGIDTFITAQCETAPEGTEPGTLDTVFPIASISKSFAAAAILKLRDAGKLELEAPFWRYLPEWKFGSQLSYGQVVTVLHLLTHTSGLPTDDPWGDRQLASSNKQLSELFTQGFSFATPPGERYVYSNLGYMVLGRIISHLSGGSSLSYIEQNFIVPLGLTKTGWDGHALKALSGFSRLEDLSWRYEPHVSARNDGAVFGGLFSSARDLTTWARFMLQPWHGAVPSWGSVLSLQSIANLQTTRACFALEEAPQTIGGALETPDFPGYCFGLRTYERAGYSARGHSGGLPGVGCHLRWSPALGRGNVSLANLTYAPTWRLSRILLDVEAYKVLHERSAQANPAFFAVIQQLYRAIQAPNPEVEANIFADNFFLDRPRHFWRAEFDRLTTRGLLAPNPSDVTQSSALSGVWRERSTGIIFTVNLSPTRPPKVQSLKIGART